MSARPPFLARIARHASAALEAFLCAVIGTGVVMAFITGVLL